MEYTLRRIIRSGNSVVVSIPRKFMKEHDMQIGDTVSIDKITKVKIRVEEVEA